MRSASVAGAAVPRDPDLSDAEQRAARRALGYLRCAAGSWTALARALRAAPETVADAGEGRRPVSASLVFRLARLAQVPVGDVVSGLWPPEGACPRCGYAPEADASAAPLDIPR